MEGNGKPPPRKFSIFIAVLVIMRVRNQKKTRVSDSATNRPEDTTKANWEERGTAQYIPNDDDGVGSKPVNRKFCS